MLRDVSILIFGNIEQNVCPQGNYVPGSVTCSVMNNSL